jgi:hypothetical protein
MGIVEDSQRYKGLELSSIDITPDAEIEVIFRQEFWTWNERKGLVHYFKINTQVSLICGEIFRHEGSYNFKYGGPQIRI